MDLFEDNSGKLYAFKIQTEGDKQRMVVFEAPEHGVEFKVPKDIFDLINAKYYHLYNLSQAPVANTAGRDDKLYKKYVRIKKKDEKPKKAVKRKGRVSKKKR